MPVPGVRYRSIQRRISVPYSVLVIGVVGLTAVTLLVLFNRYTERDMDEKLAQYAGRILKRRTEIRRGARILASTQCHRSTVRIPILAPSNKP